MEILTHVFISIKAQIIFQDWNEIKKASKTNSGPQRTSKTSLKKCEKENGPKRKIRNGLETIFRIYNIYLNTLLMEVKYLKFISLEVTTIYLFSLVITSLVDIISITSICTIIWCQKLKYIVNSQMLHYNINLFNLWSLYKRINHLYSIVVQHTKDVFFCFFFYALWFY